MVQVNLPDYTVLTVNLLLDLLYTGKTDQCGEIDHNKGELSIRRLYVDLRLDPESGGLPDIAELDTIEIERTREVVVVQPIVVEDEIKEVPSIEVATSTTVDLEAGVNDVDDEVKVIVSTSNNAVVNEVPVILPIEKVDEIIELEPKEKDTIDDDSELLGVDVDDLLSEDEVELDFDYETYENEAGPCLMDTSSSPAVKDSECLKEFSKIKLGSKISDDEPIEQKEKAFIDEVIKESSEIELDTSFEFDKAVDDVKEGVVVNEVRTRRPSLKIRLQKHSEKANLELHENKSTQKKDKMELKLSVLGEKRRKRKCPDDEDYTPTRVKTRKELESKKTIGSTLTRSRSRDVDENGHQNNKSKNLTSALDEAHAHSVREVTSSDEVKSAGSISECFRKLCDEKRDEVEFSFSSVSPEVPEVITVTEAAPQFPSTTGILASTKLPSSKQSRRSISDPSSLKKKETKSLKSKPVVKKSSDLSPEFTCPIQGCPHKHTHFNEKIHPKTYRILKHLISHHLRKEPCGIYRDIEAETLTSKKLFCSNCSYTSESRTSLLTHMAWEHGDLYNRMKVYRRKASSKEEVDIYHSVGEYLQSVWEGWKPSPTLSVSPTECSVNLTVKDCHPCDEIFPSWYELRTHILAQHCLGVLDLYISGSEEAGYECEASGDCCVKVKDKISILNHLASKEHSIISDKEIVDIALGVKRETKDNEHNVTIQDNNQPDSVVDKPKDVIEKDNAGGHKAKQGCQGSVAEKQSNKRKSRDESFEVFGSPLQIIKDPPTSKKPETNLMKRSKPVPTKEIEPQNTCTQLKLTGNEALPVKKYQCRFCAHQYVGDDDLRKHLLDKHTDRYKAVPLLEAGEKAFECVYCNKRTKMKTFHMKHLKKDHGLITLDLIKSEEDWKQGVIGFMDFCMEREESLDCMLESTAWESNLETVERSSRPRVKLQSRSDKSPVRSPDAKNYVPVPDTGDHVLETITDDSFDSLDCILADGSKEDIPEEILPKAAIPHENDETNADNIIESNVKAEPVFLQTSSPKSHTNHDSSDDDVIEEFVSITKRKPPKVKLRPRTTTEFVCKVCDKLFPSGAKVSAHVFMFHLQRMSDMVWAELFIQLENSKVCLLCGDAQERARLAKLHQYSHHKRELKKKMEEKGQDWRNLLDYIQFKVSEEMINEEDVTESEVESKTSSRSEVYNNPYYSATNQPEVMNPIPDASSINPLPVNPVPEEFPQNSRDQITLSVVPKNNSANKCGDESESDDGVEVCMESRDVNAKKSEVAVAMLKPVKTPEELKADELKAAPDPNGGELKLQCPFPKCNELFVSKPKLVDHYIESHSQSSLKLSLIRALAPERFCLNTSNRPTITLLGDDVREVFSCPQCEVQFVELQLQARHVARHSDSSAAQCDHCRNFVKVGEKEQHQSVCHHRGELERIKDMQTTQKSSESKLPSTAAPTEVITIKESRNVQIGLKLYPCTHKHGGCKEVFPEKAELHKHARKCKHRPNTSFSCGHAGCTKRYYYKEDYEKHVAKFHSAASEALPSTSTSSTSVICTPTLHTCNECSSAFPSQQGLLDHTEKAHQLLPEVPCQIKE